MRSARTMVQGRCAGSGNPEDAGGILVQHLVKHILGQAEAGQLVRGSARD
jgi:hypothetical protein